MNKTREKAIVAMSGGVDSSVAAAILAQADYDVTGVFMCLGAAGAGGGQRGCCSPADAADARRVAGALGIDMFVLNLADAFEPIVADFAAEYARGRTPNPCVHCNSRVKFGRLLRRADDLGIDYIATGHYARIVQTPTGPAIARAANRAKDQSYALFAVARAALGRILLPLGDVADKQRVRDLARGLGLSVHDKPDSQEICFVEDDDYAALLAQRAPEALRAGPIVDSAGKVLGEHHGYGRFTIGQRRGLRVAAGVPMYVIGIDAASATVVIGPREETFSRRLRASGASWHVDVEAGQAFRAIVQVRYNHTGVPAIVTVGAGESFEAVFDEPVSAVAPGQAAVCYDGDRLLGGGWID
ncbi:MAG: tRNA 2-thiouridine(34) synthase MnmA [Planctomycetota bacterium]